jgi:hypothetical protein
MLQKPTDTRVAQQLLTFLVQADRLGWEAPGLFGHDGGVRK